MRLSIVEVRLVVHTYIRLNKNDDMPGLCDIAVAHKSNSCVSSQPRNFCFGLEDCPPGSTPMDNDRVQSAT